MPRLRRNFAKENGLFLDRKSNWLNQNLVAHLQGNMIAAGLHLRDLHDDLSIRLIHDCRLEILRIIGQKDGCNGGLSQIFPGQGHTVIYLAGRWVHRCNFRIALSDQQGGHQDRGGKKGKNSARI